MGLCLHLLGSFGAAVEDFKQVLVLYDPEAHRALANVAAYDMRALAPTYLSFDLFILGYPHQATSRGEDALSIATMFHLIRRADRQAEAALEEVFSLAIEQNLSVWLPSSDRAVFPILPTTAYKAARRRSPVKL
jgi:hypothetical protein